MRLNEYLAKYNMKVMDFAKKVGYAPNYISAVSSGNRKATKKFKKAMKFETNGEVTFDVDDEQVKKSEEI